MVHECNKYMAGANRFDQSITYYRYSHRFNKWWKNYFAYILE